jgi:hypothetical protein
MQCCVSCTRQVAELSPAKQPAAVVCYKTCFRLMSHHVDYLISRMVCCRFACIPMPCLQGVGSMPRLTFTVVEEVVFE